MKFQLKQWHLLLILGAILTTLSSCGSSSGGGGGGTTPTTAAPSAPASVAVTPGNGKATVSWTAATGATSYKVYYGTTEGVTSSSPSVTSTTTSVDITSLSNNTPLYVAVAASNAGGASALSGETCGVPSVGAATSAAAGLTLWDGLCSSHYDGSKFINPRFTRSIQSAAAHMVVSADSMEASSTRGFRPNAALAIPSISATKRVTNLQATMNVPASDAFLDGSAQWRVELNLNYQPAANRLAFSGGSTKTIFAQVGILDNGSGPQFYRTVGLCAVASCATTDQVTGIVFTDGTFREFQSATYDTTYTFRIALDETTNIFTFEVSGGALSGTLTGTADASALFTAQVVDSVTDAASALLRARVQDGGTGGGSASVRGIFDDVQVGINTSTAAAPATLVAYDDFSGTGGNSGTDFSLTNWANGDSYIDSAGGRTIFRNKLTGTVSANQSQNFPITVSTTLPTAISVDATVTSITAPATANASNTQNMSMQMTLYNDGTSAVPFNQTGDVWAGITLNATGAFFYAFKCTTATCTATTSMQTGTTTLAAGSIPFGLNTTHTLRTVYDPASHAISYSVDDGAATVVDPTTVNTHIGTAAAYAAAPNAGFAQVRSFNRVFTSGENGAVDGYVNNFMIKP
jgi:hypothetical protein